MELVHGAGLKRDSHGGEDGVGLRSAVGCTRDETEATLDAGSVETLRKSEF
jgi:hypothetical protein